MQREREKEKREGEDRETTMAINHAQAAALTRNAYRDMVEVSLLHKRSSHCGRHEEGEAQPTSPLEFKPDTGS